MEVELFLIKMKIIKIKLYKLFVYFEYKGV